MSNRYFSDGFSVSKKQQCAATDMTGGLNGRLGRMTRAGLWHKTAPAGPLSASRRSQREKEEGETDKRGLTSTSSCPDAPSSVPLSPFNLGPDRSGGGDAARLPGPQERVTGAWEVVWRAHWQAHVPFFSLYTLCQEPRKQQQRSPSMPDLILNSCCFRSRLMSTN